ncbi:GPR endopeptidase [Clostridium botulinum]|uniref:Germination protease n=1 Tax=Clostridium botulinum TaxID=1491 RepID=A0A9Q1V0C3_CLOBO|nr:GPR endopeptidase [Clostridium botulinum]AEB76514.1 spore protease [Clostridium botulinum BKT015925]KEH97460.1 peptidase [Clostridium botulinum D str. 16868]KEI03467.1 peptidase [Clostridium botulinum C/D str. Sp77]KLU76104.1 peptidase [Clostridium botulinum V891]KOA74037.1 peptidase [Clostridium botulinum]
MKNIRTDLAVEAKEIYEEENGERIQGVEFNEDFESGVKVTDVRILDENGEKSMGKPIGRYITLDLPEFVNYDKDIMDDVSKVFANTLSSMINIDKSMTTLVVGLGNWNVTPDALGPKVVSKLMITRHLRELVPDKIDENIRPVCALSPGVLGITGIETGEIIKAVVDKIKPNLIICIDALASRSTERVNKTIQIGNTGISPGSGIGNKRMEISEKTLGVPVIAIGVPTVVHAVTLANDSIDLAIDAFINQSNKGSEFFKMLNSIDKAEKQSLLNEILYPYIGEMFVTPKEIDMIIDVLSKIIAGGINISLQPALDLEDINKYLN